MKILYTIIFALCFLTKAYSIEQSYELFAEKKGRLAKAAVQEKHPGIKAFQELQKLPGEMRRYFEAVYPDLKDIKKSDLNPELANQALEAQALYGHYTAMQEKEGSLIIPPAYAFMTLRATHLEARWIERGNMLPDVAPFEDWIKNELRQKKSAGLPSHVLLLLSGNADVRAQCAYALRRYFEKVCASKKLKKPVPYEYIDFSIPSQKLLDELKRLKEKESFSTIIVKDCSRITKESPLYDLLWKAHTATGKRIILIADSDQRFSMRNFISNRLPHLDMKEVSIHAQSNQSDCSIL